MSGGGPRILRSAPPASPGRRRASGPGRHRRSSWRTARTRGTRQDLAAKGDVHFGERLPQRLADTPFVFRMREGEEQAYGDRLYLRLLHGGDGGFQARVIERRQLSVGPIRSSTVKRSPRGTRAGGRSCARS